MRTRGRVWVGALLASPCSLPSAGGATGREARSVLLLRLPVAYDARRRLAVLYIYACALYAFVYCSKGLALTCGPHSVQPLPLTLVRRCTLMLAACPLRLPFALLDVAALRRLRRARHWWSVFPSFQPGAFSCFEPTTVALTPTLASPYCACCFTLARCRGFAFTSACPVLACCFTSARYCGFGLLPPVELLPNCAVRLTFARLRGLVFAPAHLA